MIEVEKVLLRTKCGCLRLIDIPKGDPTVELPLVKPGGVLSLDELPPISEVLTRVFKRQVFRVKLLGTAFIVYEEE